MERKRFSAGDYTSEELNAINRYLDGLNEEPVATDYMAAIEIMYNSYDDSDRRGFAQALLSISEGMYIINEDISALIRGYSLDVFNSPLDVLPWNELFKGLVDYAVSYETEPRRTHGLTHGEFLRTFASNIQRLARSGAFSITSPHGDHRNASYGHVMSSASGVLFTLASFFGCRRSPKIRYNTFGDNGNNPWSTPRT